MGQYRPRFSALWKVSRKLADLWDKEIWDIRSLLWFLPEPFYLIQYWAPVFMSSDLFENNLELIADSQSNVQIQIIGIIVVEPKFGPYVKG